MIMLLISLALLLLLALLVIWQDAARRHKAQQASCEWQQEKMRRAADGWRPALWDEGVSDDEKVQALKRYLKGDDVG